MKLKLVAAISALTGAYSCATEWSAAKCTEANEGGCSKGRPDNHQR